MLNIARGNEIASSLAGIALVGELLRSCPNFSGIDRLRLPKTSRGHVSHGTASTPDYGPEKPPKMAGRALLSDKKKFD